MRYAFLNRYLPFAPPILSNLVFRFAPTAFSRVTPQIGRSRARPGQRQFNRIHEMAMLKRFTQAGSRSVLDGDRAYH